MRQGVTSATPWAKRGKFGLICRAKRIAGGYTTNYIWEGSQVIAEYSDGPQSGRGLRYYLADRLSTRLMLNGSGAVKGTQDHLPFGEEAAAVGESDNHRFTSYERDSESGTDYAINRQYSYLTGRFMRPDPVSGSIGNPQSLNRYAYVGNDPINFLDPLGLTQCFLDGMSVDCGVVFRMIETGDFEKVSYTVNGFTTTINRNDFYDSATKGTSDLDTIVIGTTFNNTAFEAAIRNLLGALSAGSSGDTKPSPFGGGGDFVGAGATGSFGDPELLFRGDRPSRTPDIICKEGFKPKGGGNDLYKHVTSSTYESRFVSTSRSKKVATGFVRNNGFVYAINSARGIDVNQTLGSSSPYPEQQEVAIPEGINPSEILGAYVVKGGKVTNEYIPCR